MSKVDVFGSVLESFENENMKLYCIDMIKLMPATDSAYGS